MKRLIILVTIIGIGFTCSLCADDFLPPSWRGTSGSTMQAWEFNTDENPIMIPDVDQNPYGVASLEIMGNFPYTRWKEEDYGHFGVWKFEDWMVLNIPNNPVANPYKEIWIQLTYYSGSGIGPEIITLPNGTLPEVVLHEKIDEYYYHTIYSIIIEPNPSSEEIWFEPRDCTIYIDELVVDTRCVPEPMTMSLLGLGGLAVLLRRHHS